MSGTYRTQYTFISTRYKECARRELWRKLVYNNPYLKRKMLYYKYRYNIYSDRKYFVQLLRHYTYFKIFLLSNSINIIQGLCWYSSTEVALADTVNAKISNHKIAPLTREPFHSPDEINEILNPPRCGGDLFKLLRQILYYQDKPLKNTVCAYLYSSQINLWKRRRQML